MAAEDEVIQDEEKNSGVAQEREEQEAILDTYLQALGMI